MAAVIAAKGDPTPWFENGMSNKLLLVSFIFYILSLLTGQVGTNLRTHQLLSDDNLGKWISDFICEYDSKEVKQTSSDIRSVPILHLGQWVPGLLLSRQTAAMKACSNLTV